MSETTVTAAPAVDVVDPSKALAKLVLKRIAIQVVVAVAAGAIVHAIENKFYPEND